MVLVSNYLLIIKGSSLLCLLFQNNKVPRIASPFNEMLSVT